MKSRPILFAGPMVSALLNGNKTQTRRAIKPQPTEAYWDECRRVMGGDMSKAFPVMDSVDGRNLLGLQRAKDDPGQATGFGNPNIKCPYGPVGSHLWVRETFVIEDTREYAGEPHFEVPKDRPIKKMKESEDGCYEYPLIPHYRATDPDPHIVPYDSDGTDPDDDRTRWQPSIFMPRWASRITLEITEIRAQRLQEVSEGDAKSEGCCPRTYQDGRGQEPAALDYRRVWEQVNGKGSWDLNPWVWALTFRRVMP